jgi:DegV family protein with EDD domain
MSVRVVTDSTSDLPREVASELGITVVPALVHFGDTVYRDGLELATDDFYYKLEAGPILPKTSPPSPGTFREIYHGLAGGAEGIVSIHVASKLSATVEAAKIGAAGLDCPVSVVDSQSASMACGLLAIIAARAAREGATLEEIEELVNDAVPRTVTYGLFDTLEYLAKGGRIGRAQAMLGTLLRIKPILAIRSGEVVPAERVRTRARAIDRLCELVQEGGTPVELSVMDSTSPADADTLVRMLTPVFPPERMYRAKIGPVMGVYVGPRALGVAVTWGKTA